MSKAVPRVRMFAGPNGSGKTTVKTDLRKPDAWFGAYVNPDDLEKTVRETGFLSLVPFGLTMPAADVAGYFAASAFMRSQNLSVTPGDVLDRDGGLAFRRGVFTAYHASVLADLLRQRLLAAGRSFTFETVMSAPDKVRLLAAARAAGFRTYLYFIATEDPEINVQRVRNRVADGGHGVPEGKIVERYHRSLTLLVDALRHTHRAYLFDTSGEDPWFFAEVTDGRSLELKGGEIPNWFEPIWQRFEAAPS